jgi:hypothetical protein
MGELKHGKNMQCKHAIRPILAGFSTFVHKVHLRITRSAHDIAVSGAKSRALYAGKYGILSFKIIRIILT